MASRRSFFKNKTVLVVDDSDQIRSYFKSMLLLIGFDEITLARDAETALPLCRRIPFDFILCDLHLGSGRDGYQLFEVLRNERLLKAENCFLVISAERQRQAIYGIIEYQPDDYLLKPFSYAELERRITRAYHLKQALKLAYQAINQQEFSDAVEACDYIVDHRSKYAMHATRLKAELLIRLEKFADAEHLYQWALTVRDFAWAKLGLAVTYGYQGRQDEAEALLQELSGQAETRVEALDWLTRLYISQQNSTAALAAVEQVAKSSPRNYLRQHVLATLAVIENRKDLSVQVHHRLLSAARHSMHDTADNMLNYARALVEQAKDQEPKERKETFLRLDSFLPTIKKRFHPASYEHDRLVVDARIAMLEGKTKEAIRLLEHSEQLSLEKHLSPAAMLDRARAYFETGNLAMCDHYMAALAALTQDNNLYCSAIGMMMQHEQKKHQVLRQQLLERNAAGMQAYGSGDFSMAIDYFRTALESMPANVNIALNLLQALSMRDVLNGDHKALAKHCIGLIEDGQLPVEQQKRYQVLLGHLDI